MKPVGHLANCYRKHAQSLLKNKFIRDFYARGLHALHSRTLHEFYGDLEGLPDALITEAEVNRRLTGHEFSFNDTHPKTIFSANQVGVNRPVEDRWSVFHYGECTPPSGFSLYCSANSSSSLKGGTIYTVADGHGGHTCAHAVNLLHADYLVGGLLSPSLAEIALDYLSYLQTDGSKMGVGELTELLWSHPCGFATPESEYVGMPRPNVEQDYFRLNYNPDNTWASWGSWGPITTKVKSLHLLHLKKFISELLSTSVENFEGTYDIDSNGDVSDRAGYVVVSFADVQRALATSCRFNINAPNVSSERIETPSSLRDEVASVACSMRNGLRRLDADTTSAALPAHVGTASLDKALLRIVLSGCVTTTAYIPDGHNEVYIAQVGDCAAVLGQFMPSEMKAALQCETDDFPDYSNWTSSLAENAVYRPSDWEASLLVQPHNAYNQRELKRLRSGHPLCEADLIIREERLLGELIPLRAFGDIRYKWRVGELKHVANLLDLPPNYPFCANFYTTPPYLTATPQVLWKPLLPNRDHFLILASDGLWDMMNPNEAIQIVAQHWYDYKGRPSDSGPGDTAASRLIRTALGGFKMDPRRISAFLSLPAPIARFYRDDITAIVIYLPTSSDPIPS